MTNLEYLKQTYKKFVGLTREKIEEFVYLFGYFCPSNTYPHSCRECGSCIDLFLDSEYNPEDYTTFWEEIAYIENERNITKKRIDHKGMRYRCPMPTTSCEYYRKNGFCKMVDEGITPDYNCAIAYIDKYSWEPITITNIKRTRIVRRVSDKGDISMTIAPYLMKELNIFNDAPLELIVLEDNIGKKYIALSPYDV